MEAKRMESVIMQTLRWYKRRTDEGAPSNYFACCNSAYSAVI